MEKNKNTERSTEEGKDASYQDKVEVVARKRTFI